MNRLIYSPLSLSFTSSPPSAYNNMSCLFIIQKECCCGCVCEGGFQRQRAKTTGGFLDTVHTNRLRISTSYPRSYRYEGTNLSKRNTMSLSSLLPNAKKQATKVASPRSRLVVPTTFAIDIMGPRLSRDPVQ